MASGQPLDNVAERFLISEGKTGPDLSGIDDEDRCMMTRGLFYWYVLNHTLLAYGYLEFSKHFTKEQLLSFRLLREWWRAEYQPTEASLAYIFEILDQCEEVSSDEDDQEGLRELLPSLQVVRWPTGNIASWEPDRDGTYSRVMFRLWKQEFCYYDGERDNPMRYDNLIQERQEATLKAWCQRTSMATFCDAISRSDVASEYLQAKYLQKYERVNSNECQIPPLLLASGPLVDACPWLDVYSNGQREDMPYYLWDRNQHRTIITSELAIVVEYTAVSHTWGRWQKRDKDTGEVCFDTVRGVPWKIPLNNKFDIHMLGERLDGLQCSTRYIWFDLFCIPQEGGDIMAREITRQALIFRNARHAVAWLNDISDVLGMGIPLRMMCLSMLYWEEGSEEFEFTEDMINVLWRNAAGRSSGLLEHREGEFESIYIRPSSWFTSLWTLQEICLRPDMWICTSTWDEVSVAYDIEGPLSIMGVLVIWERYWHEIYFPRTGGRRRSFFDPFYLDKDSKYGQNYIAFTEFRYWAEGTELGALANMTRTHVLALGDRRSCTERRAEAIMSALGTTDWYEAGYSSEDCEKDLVLGKYPLTFIREIQRADPGAFFGQLNKFENNYVSSEGIDFSVALDPANREDKTRPIEFHHIWSRPRGSLLPFSRYGATFTDTMPATVNKTFKTHDSLHTWVVCPDGSVQIPKACLIASTSIPLVPGRVVIHSDLGGLRTTNVPGIHGKVLSKQRHEPNGFFQPGPNLPPKSVDLAAWVHSRGFECHAVVVYHRTWNIILKDGDQSRVTDSHGLIIAKLDDTPLLRIGTWYSQARDHQLDPVHRGIHDMPEAVDLDWTIA